MNIIRKLELIENLKEEVSKISYGTGVAKKIIVKAEMIIRQVFGEKSRYLELLEDVDFFPMYVFDTTRESDFIRSFEEGKTELLNLCDVMSDEIKIQLTHKGSKQDSQSQNIEVHVERLLNQYLLAIMNGELDGDIREISNKLNVDEDLALYIRDRILKENDTYNFFKVEIANSGYFAILELKKFQIELFLGKGGFEATKEQEISKPNETNPFGSDNKSRFDKLVHRIKDHPIISIIIFLCFSLYVVWGFAEGTVIPFYKWVSNEKSSIPLTEYSAVDYLRASYAADSLRKNGFVRGSVSRRDEQFCYLIPSNWDKDEPLDGPAGNRYQSYYLPSDPRCKIVASTQIICLEDILENDSVFHICTLEQFIDDRINYLDSVSTKFNLISTTPVNRYYFQSNDPYEIEGRRIFYNHEIQGTAYTVIEQLVYSNDIGFILSFETPSSEFNNYSQLFTEVASKSFYKDLMVDLNF